MDNSMYCWNDAEGAALIGTTEEAVNVGASAPNATNGSSNPTARAIEAPLTPL